AGLVEEQLRRARAEPGHLEHLDDAARNRLARSLELGDPAGGEILDDLGREVASDAGDGLQPVLVRGDLDVLGQRLETLRAAPVGADAKRVLALDLEQIGHRAEELADFRVPHARSTRLVSLVTRIISTSSVARRWPPPGHPRAPSRARSTSAPPRAAADRAALAHGRRDRREILVGNHHRRRFLRTGRRRPSPRTAAGGVPALIPIACIYPIRSLSRRRRRVRQPCSTSADVPDSHATGSRSLLSPPRRGAARRSGRCVVEARMATEFQVVLEDKLGALARLGDILGDARVNIEAIHGVSLEQGGLVQFVPNDPEAAARAPAASGVAYTWRDVLIVRVLDEPGMLGDVALVMSTAGININSIYVTSHGHVVLGVDDVVGATQVAAGMAVMQFD